MSKETGTSSAIPAIVHHSAGEKTRRTRRSWGDRRLSDRIYRLQSHLQLIRREASGRGGPTSPHAARLGAPPPDILRLKSDPAVDLRHILGAADRQTATATLRARSSGSSPARRVPRTYSARSGEHSPAAGEHTR